MQRLVLISKEAMMSPGRVTSSCLVVGAVVIAAGWYGVQAFPLVQERGDVPIAAPPGPVERRARPVTPENPIPRRIHFVAPEYPVEAAELEASGTTTVRLTLDESGRFAEARVTAIDLSSPRLGVGISGADRRLEDLVAHAPEAHRPAVESALRGFARAALDAIRQWQYDPPAEGPISFAVKVNFAADGEAPDAPPERSADSAGSDDALRVGGDIRPPTKVAHANPVYPEDAKAAGVEGMVVLETRIEKDGTVGEARVVQSVPMLDQAAVDAVRQWRFEPTLLNGAPVPVVMTVTIAFRLD
jgi:protein TonB